MERRLVQKMRQIAKDDNHHGIDADLTNELNLRGVEIERMRTAQAFHLKNDLPAPLDIATMRTRPLLQPPRNVLCPRFGGG